MQVNVKELTGVLHLSLVFMIVLVLQSFLAVSLQVCCVRQSKLPVFSSVTSISKCVNHPKLPASPQHFQVQV